MLLEIHIIQNYPAANLNRDENGLPKSTVLGGRPRSRISSQCQKRAARLYYQKYANIDPKHTAKRSRAWMPEIETLLIQQGVSPELATVAAKLALSVFGVKFKGEEIETNTILFLGKTEIAAIATILIQNWAEIEPGLSAKEPAFPKEPNIAKIIEKTLVEANKPGDIALFGRMMASLPSTNIDAAVQVAHAIGVGVLSQEFDFFTAVDDLNSDDTGADHIGEKAYNSSTYYRYANVDCEQAIANLGGAESAPEIIRAFIEAFIRSNPTGSQNSFAAHTLPALVAIVIPQGQALSLINAFEKPINPKGSQSVLDNAVIALDNHWQELNTMYGNTNEFVGVVSLPQLVPNLINLQPHSIESIDRLIKTALAKVFK
jgi:CRISPR system Cascade subunit CasC